MIIYPYEIFIVYKQDISSLGINMVSPNMMANLG